MFTGCGVVSGQNQCLTNNAVKPQPGLEVNKPIQYDNGIIHETCPIFQGQNYTNSVTQPVGLNGVSNIQKPIPLPISPPAIKLGQDGFKKVCRTEEESPCPFPGLPSGVLEMRVKEGSKIRNLMGFAMARMQGEKGGSGGSAGAAGLRQVVFTGSGRAVTKTITCAEIMKRKVGCLHQLTKLQYKVVKEVWESNQGSTSEMTVHRTVPSISILLSKDPLDPQEPGYQPPEAFSALWEDRAGSESAAPTTCKRPLGSSPYSGFSHPKKLCLGSASLSPSSSLTS
ncbi:ribonuclease P protein subunit p25a [Austrofundulus limnaeus]|uniref:Ribonuclease P protein subunit p25-like n=1 Tax=Austrofundulus limnaeus TaxID=52670 RepID=A0A2I4B6S7_AUSLI|nr:PREDICTED: ribonuclease P protein subunit p25-like [Austrofundulus limnaeus]XP_013863437.1 PREDICTED: ribonuclease P protein subunit p25-like [Austrofundulus limnaeus]